MKACRPPSLYRPNTSQTVLANPEGHREDWGNQLGGYSDTAILGRFIQRLRRITEWLGERIYLAQGTSPHLPLLEDETLDRAFSIARIFQLKNYKLRYPDRLVPHRISGVAELSFETCEKRGPHFTTEANPGHNVHQHLVDSQQHCYYRTASL
jgi:hypothetical protein